MPDAPCNHREWSTHLDDQSGSGGYDDWAEFRSGRFDASFYHKCTACGKVEDQETIKVSIEWIGYGDKHVPGRLALQEFA